MRKRLSSLVILYLVINLIYISNAYAVTVASPTAYYAYTSTPSTTVDSGPILWADPLNTTATFGLVVYSFTLQPGDSVYFDFYDSTGNFKKSITAVANSMGGKSVGLTMNMSPNNGLKIRLVSSSASGDRNVYLVKATNNEGNTTTFPPPDITPPGGGDDGGGSSGGGTACSATL